MARPHFSLLLPVYDGDDSSHLRRAFTSAVQGQSLPPSEVVIVQDGPVRRQLADELQRLVAESPVPTTIVRLEQNGGLAAALTRGLEECRYDIVARMDADDISAGERFEIQLPMLDLGFDLVGSGMHEFMQEGMTERIVGRRIPPTGHDAIVHSARFRSPFNHPTVVYRKAAVREAGGYEPLALMEDYWLFARMILGGARVANSPLPLVEYRVSSGSYRRRGGVHMLRSELALQRKFRSVKFTTRSQFARNVAVRGLYRLVPEAVRRRVYRRVFAENTVEERSEGVG